jgi:hypothetical protein
MTDDPNELWLTRAQAAALLQITPRHFSSEVVPKLQPREMRGTGAAKRYLGSAAVQARFGSKEGQGISALERSRLADAIAKETTNLERQRKLLPRNEIEPALLQLAGILRQAADRLQREYGADAAEIINDALGEWFERCKEVLSRGDADTDSEQSDADGAASHDAADPQSPLAINAGVRRGRNRHPVRAVSRQAV